MPAVPVTGEAEAQDQPGQMSLPVWTSPSSTVRPWLNQGQPYIVRMMLIETRREKKGEWVLLDGYGFAQ